LEYFLNDLSGLKMRPVLLTKLITKTEKETATLMKLRSLVGGFIAVLILGTIGYHLIEGWGFFDSFYMTAITITTVGSEVHPLSQLGRVFTLIVLFSGFGVAFAALSQIAASIFRGEVQRILGRRRMEKGLKNMRDHYILCGYGRMGKIIAEEFIKKGTTFNVIELKPEEFRGDGEKEKFPFIIGDASHEDCLKSAGVDRALGVVTAVSTDADNAFIVMTARGMNSKLSIVARAAEVKSINKLKLAGANKVISPYVIGGTRIAQAVLNPALVDFIEIATDQGSLDIEMADVHIPLGSEFEGMALDNPKIKSLDLIIVSIQREDKSMVFKPDANTQIASGDRVIAVGRPEQIQRMITRAQHIF
jgi:voltage-gated potassium channel